MDAVSIFKSSVACIPYSRQEEIRLVVAFRGATGLKTTRRAAAVMGVGEAATFRAVSRVSLWRWESPCGRWKRDKVAPPILDATHP